MIFIIDFGSSKTGKIGESLLALGCNFKAIDWNSPLNLSGATGIILSGAPVLLTETDPNIYLDRFLFLKKINIPLLGICFGHQLLGLLFDGMVFKGEPVRTETAITISAKDDLFEGFSKKIKMMEDHTEGITLPPLFTKLASSEHYQVEAMKHEDRPFWGVQFHPEVSGDAGKQLFNNFCKSTLK